MTRPRLTILVGAFVWMAGCEFLSAPADGGGLLGDGGSLGGGRENADGGIPSAGGTGSGSRPKRALENPWQERMPPPAMAPPDRCEYEVGAVQARAPGTEPRCGAHSPAEWPVLTYDQLVAG
jgi:hypothetical protein